MSTFLARQVSSPFNCSVKWVNYKTNMDMLLLTSRDLIQIF